MQFASARVLLHCIQHPVYILSIHQRKALWCACTAATGTAAVQCVAISTLHYTTSVSQNTQRIHSVYTAYTLHIPHTAHYALYTIAIHYSTHTIAIHYTLYTTHYYLYHTLYTVYSTDTERSAQ